MKSKHAIIALIAVVAVGFFALPAFGQDPIPLHPDSKETVTQLEKDIEALDKSILDVAEAFNHAAAKLSAAHGKTWSLPDDRLLAVLNANVQRTVALSNVKDEAASKINDLLNRLNIARFTNRAPIGIGRADVKFDQDSKKFVIIPPAEPAPEPAPE